MKAKKAIALLLAAATVFVYGCGNAEKPVESGTSVAESTVQSTVDASESESGETESSESEEALVDNLAASSPVFGLEASGHVMGDLYLPETTAKVTDTDPYTIYSDGTVVLNNVSYVMIYNPLMYVQADAENDADPNYLSTGDLSSQIILPGSRAGLEDEQEFTGAIMAQPGASELATMLDGINREDLRAGGMDPIHELGEKYDFYIENEFTGFNQKSEFTCLYEGTYCYVWSNSDDVSKIDAEELGKAFDEEIYEQDVEMFGTARFTENGGKVNILFHNMAGNGLCGYFSPRDLFATQEFYPYTPDDYKWNADHAIIHINSKLLKTDLVEVKSTLAHEFQHLICFTDYFACACTSQVDVWFNEMMSAFAEDMIYPRDSITEGRIADYLSSDLYRNGQSLYNFNVITDYDNFDIGSYGMVYLFAKFFEVWGGEDGPYRFHSYWRESGEAGVSVAESLYETTYEGMIEAVDGLAYTANLEKAIGSDYDIWLSKLIFDFYLYQFTNGSCSMLELKPEWNIYQIYNTLEPAMIEGGGRILVATKDGSYTIPEDSDHNLYYVGFDKDFNIVSGFVY